jgi:hypothetical protein
MQIIPSTIMGIRQGHATAALDPVHLQTLVHGLHSKTIAPTKSILDMCPRNLVTVMGKEVAKFYL